MKEINKDVKFDFPHKELADYYAGKFIEYASIHRPFVFEGETPQPGKLYGKYIVLPRRQNLSVTGLDPMIVKALKELAYQAASCADALNAPDPVRVVRVVVKKVAYVPRRFSSYKYRTGDVIVGWVIRGGQ